jgi:DNA-binding NtrC family response regulator
MLEVPDMTRLRILVVDDEESVLRACSRALKEIPDATVVTEQRSTRVAELLAQESFHLLVSDIRMPEMSGVELLKVAHEQDPDLPVILITGYPTIESAVESVKSGAADYIVKPVLPDDLLATAQLLSHQCRSYRASSIEGAR